jgi:hypothetical protein
LKFAYETVFHHEVIIGVRDLLRSMTELVVKIAILIIPHFHHAIFYAKSIAEILIYPMVMDLYKPVFNVFFVEKGNPSSSVSMRFFRPAFCCTTAKKNKAAKDRD